MKIYQNNEFPKVSDEDTSHSVDVITRNENGLLNIGYYHFKDKKWYWHTDTLVDPYEDGLEGFVWMYAPKQLTVKQ